VRRWLSGGARKGLAGALQEAIQEAILGLLSMLLAMLEDFRAGRLAPITKAAEDVASDAGADGVVEDDPAPARPVPSSWRPGAGIATTRARLWGRDCRKNSAVCGPAPRSGGLTREADRRANGTHGAVAHPPPQPPGSILGSRPRTGAVPHSRARGEGEECGGASREMHGVDVTDRGEGTHGGADVPRVLSGERCAASRPSRSARLRAKSKTWTAELDPGAKPGTIMAV